MHLSKPQTMALWNLSDRSRGVNLLSQDTSGHIIVEVQHSMAGRGLKRYKLPHEGGVEDITPKPKEEHWLDALMAEHSAEEIVAELERRGVRMSAFDA